MSGFLNVLSPIQSDTDTENDVKTSLSLFFKTIEKLSERLEYIFRRFQTIVIDIKGLYGC